MKTKNLVLAFAATLFAVGSVFATLAPESPYALIRFSGETTPECQILNGSCDDTGTNACRIRINGIDYQAFKVGCVTPLKNTTNSVAATLTNANIVQVYNTPL